MKGVGRAHVHLNKEYERFLKKQEEMQRKQRDEKEASKRK